MPIQFQPASPAGAFPNLSAGGGAAEVIMRMAPQLVAAAEARARAAAAGAENQTRASIASAQLGQRSEEAAMEMASRGADVGMRGQIAGMGMEADFARQQAAQQFQLVQHEQEIQGRMQLMKASSLQHLELESQKQKNSEAEIKRAVDEKILTPEQGSDALARLYGVKDRTDRELAEAHLVREKAQMRAAEQQAAMVARLQGTQRASELGFWHKTANALAGNPNPEPGGIQAIPVFGSDGQVLGHQVLSPEGKTTWAQKEQTIRGLQPADFSKLFTTSLEAAKKMHTTPADVDKGTPESVDIEAAMNTAEKIFERQLKMVDRETEKRKPGYKPPPSSDLGGQTYPRGVPGSDAPVSGMEQQGPQSPVQRATPEFKSFDLAKPDTRSKEQEQAVTILRKYQDKVSASDLPPEQKQRWSGAVDHMLRSLAQYGSYGNLPPEEKKLHDNVLQVLDGLKAAPKRTNIPAAFGTGPAVQGGGPWY